jgi:hypothetical protein
VGVSFENLLFFREYFGLVSKSNDEYGGNEVGGVGRISCNQQPLTNWWRKGLS